ncbi:MAG: hypothetical protein QG577_1454 [Thermodesulfobacteriota bacterium]|nr:hypothetical protein [Thermodesulfobacteriota bacterium]
MRWSSIRGARFFILLSAVGALLIMGMNHKVPVIRINDAGPFFLVSEGDILSRSYTHSMYHERVTENFKVAGGKLKVESIVTESDAVRAYLGIGPSPEEVPHQELEGFIIPGSSTGRHALEFRGQIVELGMSGDCDGKIHIRLEEMNVFQYAALCLRG